MGLLFAILPALCATFVEARVVGGIGKGWGRMVSLLGLSPVDTATFVFYVLLALLTFGQTLNALNMMLMKRPPGADYPRRVPVLLLITLTAFMIFAAYGQSTYIIARPGGVGALLVGVMDNFARSLAHIFFYAGIFLILDWRCGQQAVQYGHNQSKQFATAIRIVPPVLLFIMLVCATTRAGIGGSGAFLTSEHAYNAYNALYHLYLAMFVLCTIAVCGTAVVLWTNRRPEDSSYELLQFDDQVLSRIVHYICPFVAVQALYEVITDIIAFTFARSIFFDWSALGLADVIIHGIIYLTIIHIAIRLGFLSLRLRAPQLASASSKRAEGFQS